MNDMQKLISLALEEDIGTGDISAQLIPKHLYGKAHICAREPAVVCGREWVDEVFAQVDNKIQIKWLVTEGDYQDSPCVWVEIEGPLASILTAERTALNFLQTLSGVATKTKRYVDVLRRYSSHTKLLDTRKTIPGLRLAQKYAVRCGGGVNHRIGLYDEYLIKENHIEAMGSITKVVQSINTKHPVVVEVKNIDEFLEAKALGVTRVMLDNFSDDMIQEVVQLNQISPCPIEVSGGINEQRLIKLGQMGVDYISVGDLTKSIQAIDLSLLILSREENL